MDDDQKWLEAAAAIEQDIIYLKAAIADGKRHGIPLELGQEVLQLKVVRDVYQMNAANGVAFPHPDVLFCVSNSYDAANASKATRQGLKASAF